MKTALISILTATLLGIASFASGRPFDAADFTAVLFAIGLVAWTISQYSCESRVLAPARSSRFPASFRASDSKVPARLAA